MPPQYGLPRSLRAVLPLSVLALFAPVILADEEKPIEPAAINLGRPVDFDQDVYPILQANCVACHNTTTAESDLNLESAEAMLKGGSLGPAIVPGKPDESVLLGVSAHTSEPFMPPSPNDRNAKDLTPQQLGILKQWIIEGAKGGVGRSASSMKWQPINSRLQAVFSMDLDQYGRFVAAGRGAEITVYDLKAGFASQQLDDPALHKDGSPTRPVAHRDFVHAIAFHPSGNLFASGGYQVVKLWERQFEASAISLPDGTVQRAVSADGRFVATATAGPNITVSKTGGETVATIQTDNQPVSAIALSATGDRIVAGLADGRIQVAVVAAPDAVVRSEVLAAPAVRVVAGAAADSRIAVLLPDGSVKLLAQGGEPAALTVAAEIAAAPAPVPTLVTDGQLVATVAGRSVKICSMADGSVQKEFAVPDDVRSLAISESAARAVVTLNNGQTLLWSTAEPKQLAVLTQDLTSVRALSAAEHLKGLRDARTAVLKGQVDAAEKDLTAQKEAETKAGTELEAAAKAHEEAKTKHAESAAATAAAKKALEEKPDDEAAKKAVTDAEAAEAKTKEALTDAESKHQIAEKSKQFAAQAVERSQQRLEEKKQRHADATALAEAAVQAVEAAKPAAAAAVTTIGGTIIGNGSLIATTDTAGTCRLWSAADGAAVDVIAATLPEGVLPAAVQFGGDRAFVETSATSLQSVALLPAWHLKSTLGPPAEGGRSVFVDRVLSLAFSPDGALLAAGGGEASRSGQLTLWDTASGQLVREIPDAHSDTVYGIEFSPDGQLLASAAADKFVRLFDVATGKFVRAFEGHTHHVMDVSWKSDGTTLVSAGADNAIKVWDAETGEQSRTITTYTRQVTSLQFLDLQDDFVSSSGDKRVFLHRAGNGGTVREFKGSSDYVYRAVATPDGRIVAAGCEDGLVRVWNGADAKDLASLAPQQ
ncbi:MAG: hypothetical protein KDA96_01525 [Planctomycetaceae bacterium]|nr:hypothetical protein [Planctomycetaceae bacterium]